jgi:hypothetical protein
MPTTHTVTTTIVEFTREEADALIAAHLGSLSPQGAAFERGRISFGIDQKTLAADLGQVIPNLPPQFSVSQVANNPAVALRVTFITSTG